MNLNLFNRHAVRSAFNIARIISRHESQRQPAIFEDPNKFKEILKPARVKPNYVFSEKPIERLFLGEFDYDLLEYPEVGSLLEVNYVQDFTNIVKKNVEAILNLQQYDLANDGSTRLENLGRLKMYGLRIPKPYTGYEFCESEAGYIHETLIFDQALSKIIGENEDLGILIIMKYGSDAQKKKYLPLIANGQISTCYAHFESLPILGSSHDKTIAYCSAKGESYSLVGKKTLVYNAHLADLIIVSANTTNIDENKQDDKVKQTFFIIDKNTSGVHISRHADLLSLENDSFSEIMFDKVVVPEESILGKLHEGEEIAKKVLSLGKFNNGFTSCSVLKHMSSDAIQHNLKQYMFKEPMNEHEFMQKEVAILLREAYVVESLAYFLSGRLYWFKEPDLFLESLIVKVLASDALYDGLQQYLQLMGPDSFKREFRLEKLLSDCLFHQVFDDTNDNFKVQLTSQGIEHAKKFRKSAAGKKLEETAGKIMKVTFDKPSKLFDVEMLQGFLHPSMEDVAELLFNEITRFDSLIGQFLKSNKDDSISIPESKYLKIADMAVLIYATAATAGRASRSYCIGLKNCDAEVKLARSIVFTFHRKFVLLETELLNELKGEKDPSKIIGSQVLSQNKYIPIHPFVKK